MLVRDSRRGNGASSTELEARSREIERLKAELADVLKRTAATEGEQGVSPPVMTQTRWSRSLRSTSS
jgi:HD superfamily phosphodiesterase